MQWDFFLLFGFCFFDITIAKGRRSRKKHLKLVNLFHVSKQIRKIISQTIITNDLQFKIADVERITLLLLLLLLMCVCFFFFVILIEWNACKAQKVFRHLNWIPKFGDLNLSRWCIVLLFVAFGCCCWCAIVTTLSSTMTHHRNACKLIYKVP